MRLLLTLCFISLSVVQLRAETTVKEFRTMMASTASTVAGMKLYIKGLGDGMEWASVAIKSRQSGQQLHCTPGNLALTSDNYVHIINEQIKIFSKITSQDKLEEMAIGLLLVQGLQETFPCASK